MHRCRYSWLVVLAFLLAGCDSEPIKIGFMGGLTGRVSDLGGGGRNGALLAIEERNAAGGVRGSEIQLLIRDDQQDPERAKGLARELLEEGVVAVIGLMTSAIAVSIAPQFNASETLLMGVTITTNDLAGKDDYFLRVLAPTAVITTRFAQHLHDRLGIRHVAILYDTANLSYTRSWMTDFSTSLAKLPDTSSASFDFKSGDQKGLLSAVEKALAEPDLNAVVLVANSVDAALLAKLVRERRPELPIITSEWAGTERLIELGGRFVEGALVPQYFDRESTEPAFVAFLARYRERFGQEPGFPATLAYKATSVVLDALENRGRGQSLKEYILAHKRFPGFQGDVIFEPDGDSLGSSFLTVIEEGRFKVVAEL